MPLNMYAFNTATDTHTTAAAAQSGAAFRKEDATMNTIRFQSEPAFMLLITGTKDNDLISGSFAAEGMDIVYHKLEYVRCDRNFDEIKALQLKVRRSRASFGERITAVIDLSDWIGHENEDYFTVTAKFLCDMSDRWRYILTVGDHDKEEARDIFRVMRLYMNGIIKVDETFRCTDTLAQYITSHNTDAAAARLLAEMLMTDEMKELRTYPTLDSVCDDIRTISATGRIRLCDVAANLRDENSLPNVICKRVSLEYAVKASENESPQSELNTVA